MEYEKMEGVRLSDLWYMNQDSGTFIPSITWITLRRPTASLLFGIAAHMAQMLEPSKFLEQYIVAPNVDRGQRQGKEEYAAFLGRFRGG